MFVKFLLQQAKILSLSSNNIEFELIYYLFILTIVPINISITSIKYF